MCAASWVALAAATGFVCAVLSPRWIWRGRAVPAAHVGNEEEKEAFLAHAVASLPWRQPQPLARPPTTILLLVTPPREPTLLCLGQPHTSGSHDTLAGRRLFFFFFSPD